MGAKRTAWHFFFGILLRRHGPRGFEIRDEVPLSEEPARMDYLILRRSALQTEDDAAETLLRLWPLLPRVTVAELKSVGRPYEKSGLDRLWAYAHLHHASEHRLLGGREHLCVLLFVTSRTPTLDADAAAMGLTWEDLGEGYFRLRGGLFVLYVVELGAVAKQSDEDLLALYTRRELRTPRAMAFWGELVGAEAKMDVREFEGYEEAIQQILSALPPELRLAGLAPEQRLAGLAPEQVLGRYAPEQRLAGLAPEQRLAGLAPEQRLAGLAPGVALLALPDDMLRKLPEELLAGLPEDVRAAIRTRVGRP